MASRVVLAAAASLAVAAATNATTPPPNDKCTICEDLVKVVSGKAAEECDQLCKKSPIDDVCEKFCTLVQTEATPERVCKAVHMCAGKFNGIPPNVVKEIEKLVCEAVKEEIPEDKFANTTCVDVKKIVKFLPEQTCEDVVSKIYEDTLASCPKSLKSNGIPPAVVTEIEKLVCEAVKDEIPEDKFVNTTCVDVKKFVKFLPEQTCEDVVSKIYEDTLASCPKSLKSNGIPPAVVTEIEKLVCEAVKDEVPEDKFVNTTCVDVKKFVKFLPEQTCEDVVSKIYEDTLASCPKSLKFVAVAAATNATDPSARCTLCEELVKVAAPKVINGCEQLCKKSPIDTICEQLCTVVATEATPDRVCKAVHMCAGDSNGIPPAVVKKIEKLVCEAVEKELPEEKFASMVCEHLTKVVKFLPEKPCEEEVSKLYEKALSSCPQSILV